jgi:hypothetical protein
VDYGINLLSRRESPLFVMAWRKKTLKNLIFSLFAEELGQRRRWSHESIIIGCIRSRNLILLTFLSYKVSEFLQRRPLNLWKSSRQRNYIKFYICGLDGSVFVDVDNLMGNSILCCGLELINHHVSVGRDCWITLASILKQSFNRHQETSAFSPFLATLKRCCRNMLQLLNMKSQ